MEPKRDIQNVSFPNLGIKGWYKQPNTFIFNNQTSASTSQTKSGPAIVTTKQSSVLPRQYPYKPQIGTVASNKPISAVYLNKVAELIQERLFAELVKNCNHAK